jgi:predicted ATP-grasp superfamily ATP-dependent carboligase
MTHPLAVVMNMFYTGLGIARTLGEHGVPVLGLSSTRIYGNYTRYAKVRFCPDSRQQPESLLVYLLGLGQELGERAVIFPTRDDDVLFLDRHREVLSAHFDLLIPRREVISACLDKWATHTWAIKAGVPAPWCRLVQNWNDLSDTVREISFPCVIKPMSSHLWKQNQNWDTVGGRKAFAVHSPEELLAEYGRIHQADPRVLLQEMIPGDDDQLFIAACYLDKSSNPVAQFTAQKLVQSPALFGTGCIVQSIDRSELIEPALTVLQSMGFTGIAEVEFKWDVHTSEFKLIEINPRPWDQHRLGNACGVDLIYIAYCEYTGLPLPSIHQSTPGCKWIAEDVFLMSAVRMLWRRDPNILELFRQARGKRIYGIWSAKDKLPFLNYFLSFLPKLAWDGLRHCANVLFRRLRKKRTIAYESHLYSAKSKTY